MYYIFIVNVNCYSRKIENFANKLMFQAFDGDLIRRMPTFKTFRGDLIWRLDTKSAKSAKFNTPEILSHLFYPNLMICVKNIWLIEPNSSNQEHFLFIFPRGEVKCISHISEGECEGNIKSFLENRSLRKKVCA